MEKHLPRSLAVTAPRETTHQLGAVAGPAGARLCLHRLPLWCGLTAPQSRASSVTLWLLGLLTSLHAPRSPAPLVR